MLLQRAADIRAVNGQGKGVLHFVAFHHVELGEYLRGKGPWSIQDDGCLRAKPAACFQCLLDDQLRL